MTHDLVAYILVMRRVRFLGGDGDQANAIKQATTFAQRIT